MNTHGTSFKVYARRPRFFGATRRLDLLIEAKTWTPEREEFFFAQPLVLKKVDPEAMAVMGDEATFSLTMEAAQALMEELWECGVRPTQAAGSVGQLQATERHLADMRKLVFEEPETGVSEVR